MTDQKLIAGIFNDFLGLYTGKIQTGIRPLIEKYKKHPMLMGLLSNLDEAAKIQTPKAMKEIYSFYKEYRGRDLEDADWKELTEKARQISAGWEENEWVRRIVLEIISLLDSDDAERRRIALEVEKERLNHKFCGISDSSRSSVGSYRIASERNIRHLDIRIPVCEES